MDNRHGNRLVVLINGSRAGDAVQDEQGRLSVVYDSDWRFSPRAMPISLSMPLRQQHHPDSTVRAFMWGLLPDNELVLERWGRAYQVSPRNPFALLRHVGEDCAGAVQFSAEDRVEALLAGHGGVELTDEEEIGRRIRTLRGDPTAWHVAQTHGQFSLAGAQAKTALHYDPEAGRWGDPWGRVATTHIVKPAVNGFDDHDLNEHLCLEAARYLGMSAAASRVATFADERAIVVERYDRAYGRDGRMVRIHQEDICQALGILPTTKYQNEGGPGPEQIIELLRREIPGAGLAAQDVTRFVDALAFNWIVGGTDAHAKNYSVLISGARVRLAPLYDVASALPYEGMYLPKLRMAMRVGGEYRLEGIAGRHWRRFAANNALDPDVIVARVDELAARAPEAFARAAGAPAVKDLRSPLPERLVGLVEQRARKCRDALAG